MPSIVGHVYMYDKHAMPENQKCAHRKKIMQKYRINKLLFIIRKLIDKKKFMEEGGGGNFLGAFFIDSVT